MHAASYQRNTMWPNCVKPLLTPFSLFFNNGSTGSQNHGHCTHPSPPLMDVVGFALSYKYYSQCAFLLFTALLPVPFCLWCTPLDFTESCKCAKAAKKQALSRVKMIWCKSKWRGHAREAVILVRRWRGLVRPKIPRKCQTRADSVTVSTDNLKKKKHL